MEADVVPEEDVFEETRDARMKIQTSKWLFPRTTPGGSVKFYRWCY